MQTPKMPFSAHASQQGKSQLGLPPILDTWLDPPDPAKKAICVESECEDGVTVITDLLKNLSTDPYNEDEAELRYLYSKPSCFLILGKPGVGKTTLAKRFAVEWKCLMINSTDLIVENMTLETEMGLQCKDILIRGGAVSDEMVLKMMEEKLNSPEVAHHGYVIDDFPCLSEDLMSIHDQLELIKSWKFKPDFVINLRIPEKDIETRRLNQMVDPFTGTIYLKEEHQQHPHEKHKTSHHSQPHEDKALIEQEEMTDEEVEDTEAEDINEDKKSVGELPITILKRLVKRPEDTPQQVEENLAKYRNNMLRILEDYMGDHDQQFLLELDGNLQPHVIYKQLLQKLQTFILRPAAVVMRLIDTDDDELSEDMETEDIIRALCPKQMLAPRYRWRRSRWLRNCPVALFEGNVTPGKPEYAVSFLDKVYCLSSNEVLEKFMRNPRPYLVPKQPRTPCKISVVGQPFSGKTTLCHLLANYYGAKVFDIHKLAMTIKIEEKLRHVEQVRKDATEKAIKEVKDRIRAQWEADAQEKKREKQAQLASETEALRLEQESEEMESWEDKEIKSPKELGDDYLKIVNEELEDNKENEDEAHEEKSSGGETPSKTTPQKEDLGEEEEKQQPEEQEIAAEEGIADIADETAAALSVAQPASEAESSLTIPEPEVDETHPEVKAIVSVAVSLAEISTIQIEPEFEAEILLNTITAWEKELRDTRHDGPLHGCWVLDNFPETPELWNACLERNIIPDAVYVLGEEIKALDINKIRAMCERYCLKNRDLIFAEMNRRVLEKDLRNQEARLDAERKRIQDEEKMKKELEEEMQRQLILEEQARVAEVARQAAIEKDDHDATTADTIPADDDDTGFATPVQVPSNVLDEDKDKKTAEEEEDNEIIEEPEPEVTLEKTELELMMEQPEAKDFMEKLRNYEQGMAKLLAVISGTSSVVAYRLALEGFTIETLLEVVIKNEEKPYRYVAWEMGQVDQEEEEEDLEAENMEAEREEKEEEKEESEEEEEDPSRGVKKALGDTNYFDPVYLKEMDVLYPGNAEISAMYREKIYYFSTYENRDKFIEEPTQFLSVDKPPKTPPLRLLILGPRGAGKTLHGSHLAEKLGIFHISYRERLQEMIIHKTKKRIGPEFQDDIEESLIDDSESQLESGAGKLDATGGDKDGKKSSVLIMSNVNEEEIEDSYEGDEASQDEDDIRTIESDENENTPDSKLSFGGHEPDTSGFKDDISKGTETLLEFEGDDSNIDGTLSRQGDGDVDEAVELTEDEEAIKAFLESSEPLPTHLLDKIVKIWWTMEPFKSTGFILEGFPRTVEEARYLQESGLFPDAAIILQVSENDVTGRLLPPKLDVWRARRNKRLSKKARNKARSQAKREAAISKRREILIKERDEKRASKMLQPKKVRNEEDSEAEEENVDDDEETEYDEEEDIEAILAEEFEEEEEAEEEEDEEPEEEAVERMKNDLNEIYTDDNDRLAGVMETLEEILVPCLQTNAGRKPHIVRYIISKKIKPFVDHRSSLFERVYPVSERLAEHMLHVGYKHLSRFGRWDPVLLKDGHCIPPVNGSEHPLFPCIYRSFIYFLSSQQNRQMFMLDPLFYLNQETPKPMIPLRIAIIGPPKSGKTTLAKRFVEDYGVVRLSIGEAMRNVLTRQPQSELAKQIQWNLIRGRVVPDELQIQALDVTLLDVRCQIKGYVLDGYPMTLKQIQLMTEYSIIPVKVIEMELGSKDVLTRGVKDRIAPRAVPLHDSPQILAIKLSCYQRQVPEVREWYQNQHQNYTIVPADQSKWWVLDAVNEIAVSSIKRIQDYVHRTSKGRPAGIYGLCITPKEYRARLGEFEEYCPVSLAERGELIDCSLNQTLEYAAEYKGHYYKMAGPQELEMFLENPDKYVPPLAPRSLPSRENLPHKATKEEVETKKAEILGYCPVTYLDGNLRYEALVPGNPEFAVEYKGRIYLMENEEKLQKFMREPEKYANLLLPHKLPPAPEDMPLQNLPMLGFMEQTCAVAMIKALTAAGNTKPKYPFISSTRSALIYVAYHLKAFNPKSSAYIRKKYKQKLQQFQETCELIKYLGNNMTVRYRDPSERPKDFDNKLETFFALRGVEPTPTWLK